MGYKLIKSEGMDFTVTVLNNNKKDEELTDFINFTFLQFSDRIIEFFIKVLKGEEKEICYGFNETYITINSEVTKIEDFLYETTVDTKKFYKLILKVIKMRNIEKIKYKIKSNKILTLELFITFILIFSTFFIGIYLRNYGLIGGLCAIIVSLITQITKKLKNKISIIQLDDCIILSKKHIQKKEARSKYANKLRNVSLPMTYEEVIKKFEKYFENEKEWPFSKSCIISFYRSNNTMIKKNVRTQFIIY